MIKGFDETVQHFLAGRIWHREHIPFSSKVIDAHIQAGVIGIIPGITSKRNFFYQATYTCNRCENQEQQLFTTFHCAKCKGACTYCRKCLKMGRVSSCTELLIWKGPKLLFPTKHENNWQGQLTPQQEKAAEQLQKSTTEQKSHLVYAVCGAGKTEILFNPIYALLQQGKRVCVAAPRVDVILELEPRFKAAFPKTTLVALYGGAKPTQEPAQLILATTHQLYRFQSAFDVVFVDEADAFPYMADETLQGAVKKAAKKDAPIHFVTATPRAKLIEQATRAEAISTIPRRFHGHPLPIPQYQSLWRYSEHIQKGKLPRKLTEWMQKCIQDKRPFLIFFHKIELMTEALPLIQQLEPKIEAVHAAHDSRKEYVQALRDQSLKGLLTTTILERGITIPNVQVAVVGAEQQIFTKSALIQIGGRVGRAKETPDGDFILFHHGITHAMDEAKREIIQLNKKGELL